jgi:hypothetical protein
LTVYWPRGAKQEVKVSDVDRTIEIVESAGVASR